MGHCGQNALVDSWIPVRNALLLASLVTLTMASNALEEGDPCSYDVSKGRCLPISKCGTIREALARALWTRDTFPSCGLTVFEEMICCPFLEETPIRTVTTAPTGVITDINSEKNESRDKILHQNILKIFGLSTPGGAAEGDLDYNTGSRFSAVSQEGQIDGVSISRANHDQVKDERSNEGVPSTVKGVEQFDKKTISGSTELGNQVSQSSFPIAPNVKHDKQNQVFNTATNLEGSSRRSLSSGMEINVGSPRQIEKTQRGDQVHGFDSVSTTIKQSDGSIGSKGRLDGGFSMPVEQNTHPGTVARVPDLDSTKERQFRGNINSGRKPSVGAFAPVEQNRYPGRSAKGLDSDVSEVQFDGSIGSKKNFDEGNQQTDGEEKKYRIWTPVNELIQAAQNMLESIKKKEGYYGPLPQSNKTVVIEESITITVA